MIHRHHLATVVQHPTGGGGEAILQIEGMDVKYDAECCFRIIVFLIELANFKNICGGVHLLQVNMDLKLEQKLTFLRILNWKFD